MSEFTELPIPTKTLANQQATATETLATPLTITSGSTADIMPASLAASSFGAMLTVANGVFLTANAFQLNLSYRIRLSEVEAGQSRTINLGFRRGNETVAIDSTLQTAPVLRGQEYVVPSVVGTDGNTFTSGPGDPYNNAGFVPVVFNTSDKDIEIPAGAEIRIDFFAVCVPANTAAPTG